VVEKKPWDMIVYGNCLCGNLLLEKLRQTAHKSLNSADVLVVVFMINLWYIIILPF